MKPDDVLPCDVLVAPATIIRKGCKVSTLFRALQRREGAENMPRLSLGSGFMVCTPNDDQTFDPPPEFETEDDFENDDVVSCDCQLMPDGTCQLVGTEECDLCPNSN